MEDRPSVQVEFTANGRVYRFLPIGKELALMILNPETQLWDRVRRKELPRFMYWDDEVSAWMLEGIRK